jgi:hypothetical protein
MGKVLMNPRSEFNETIGLIEQAFDDRNFEELNPLFF